MNINEFPKGTSNKNLILINIFLIFIIFLITIKSFSSVDNIYMLNNHFFLNQNYFSEDIFLKNSTLFKYPFYYELLKFFNINIDYDLHAFLLHFTLHAISFYFLFLTIRKIFLKFDSTLTILIILALSAGKASILLNGVMSNIVISHSSTPTALVSSLNIIFLYFLISRKILGIILIPLLSLLISIKTAWFCVGVSIFYIIFFIEGKKKILVLIPIIFSIWYLFKDLNLFSSIEENLKLYEFAYNRENYATMFSKQSFVRLFIFSVSFPIFYSFIKRLENIEIKRVLNLIITLQLFLFLIILLIEIINIDHLKKWQLIAISPVRSTAFYELTFKIIFISLILNTFFNQKKLIFFPLIFCSIFFFGFGFFGNILAGIFFLILLIFYIFRSKLNFNLNKVVVIFFCAILVFPSAIYINYKLLTKGITIDYYETEKRIFLKALPKNKYSILKKYKNCKDFLFHDATGNFYSEAQGIYLDITKIKNWSSNSIIKKSLFFVDPVFLYGDILLLERNDKNYKFITKIHESIKKNIEVDKSLLNFKNKERLIILIRSNHKNIFEKNFLVYDDEFGYSFVLINYQEDILRNC
tara:strand:+ start:4512 stop:6263 length:1752 start_codon:yes stop_codon:yes gene_type:complete